MKRLALPLALTALTVAALPACSKTVPEPAGKDPSVTVNAGAKGGDPAPAPAAPGAAKGMEEIVVAPSGPDPVGGKFTMAEVRATLKGPLVATIVTNKGTLACKLYDDKAPLTVANFVGLANGLRPFRDKAHRWVRKNAYDGAPFHRIIKGFMIQGGDITNANGSGEPGYVIPDELWAGAKHDRAGLLCMANRGPDTNGAQFFITDAAAAHLDQSYTIFGECSPESVVHDIAGVPTGPMDRPETPVTIQSIRVTGS